MSRILSCERWARWWLCAAVAVTAVVSGCVRAGSEERAWGRRTAHSPAAARSLDLLEKQGAKMERDEPNGPVVGIRLVSAGEEPVQVSPGMLTGLADLNSLKRFHFSGVRLKREAMEALGKLTQLRHLYLKGQGPLLNRDDQASGDVLSGLHRLRSLDIVNPYCFVRGGLELTGLKSLRHLALSRGTLEIPAQPARDLPRLESVALWRARLEGEDWTRLGKLPKLKWFAFRSNDLTNHAVKALATSKSLEEVTLIPCPGDEPNSFAYRELAKLPRLRKLVLFKPDMLGGRAELSPETAKALGQVRGLTTLSVTTLSPRTATHFRHIRELSLRGLSPELNRELAKLPGLGKLDVWVQTRAQLAGLERLVQLTELTVRASRSTGAPEPSRKAIEEGLRSLPEHVRVTIIID